MFRLLHLVTELVVNTSLLMRGEAQPKEPEPENLNPKTVDVGFGVHPKCRSHIGNHEIVKHCNVLSVATGDISLSLSLSLSISLSLSLLLLLLLVILSFSFSSSSALSLFSFSLPLFLRALLYFLMVFWASSFFVCLSSFFFFFFSLSLSFSLSLPSSSSSASFFSSAAWRRTAFCVLP
jgi:hypothetical protein